MTPQAMVEAPVDLRLAPLPEVELRRSPWQRHARCHDRSELFFATDGEQPAERRRREAEALSLCATCPVRMSCREAGRERREIGVWGGETDEERAAAGYPPLNLARRSVIRAARAARATQAREAG